MLGLSPSQAVTLLVTKQTTLKLPDGFSEKLQNLFIRCMTWDENERISFEEVCILAGDLE